MKKNKFTLQKFSLSNAENKSNKYVFNNNRFVIEVAQELNEYVKQEDIRKFYFYFAQIINENIFDNITILLTMCINRELSIELNNDENLSSLDFLTKIDELCTNISEHYNKVNLSLLKKLYLNESEQNEFSSYLNYLVNAILSGVKYIRKKEDDDLSSWKRNEWNTQFRREERIRDSMKYLISRESKYFSFTIKNKIQIPYMYVLAWDLPELFRTFDEDNSNSPEELSYLKYLRSNARIALSKVNDNLIDILIKGAQMDKDKTEGNGIVQRVKKVSYTDLLPTFFPCEEVDYYHDLIQPIEYYVESCGKMEVPLIKKSVLKTIPLLPMKFNMKHFNLISSIKSLIFLLKKEQEELDIKKSDVMVVGKLINEMCIFISEFLAFNETNFSFTHIETMKALDYLDEIIKNTRYLEIKDLSDESKEVYVSNISNAIIHDWTKNLKKEEIDPNNISTFLYKSYFSVLKLTRNWVQHLSIRSKDINFLVFVFLISMRYIIDFTKVEENAPAWIREYMLKEYKLIEFLGEDRNLKYENCVDEIVNEYECLYKNVSLDSYCKSQLRENQIVGPHEILTIAGHEDSGIREKMTKHEIYLSFWLTIHLYKNIDDNSIIKKNVCEAMDKNLLQILERTFQYQKESKLLK